MGTHARLPDLQGASAIDERHARKLHLVQAQVLFRHGARTPVHELPGLPTDDGWAPTHAAVPLPAIQVRHARALYDLGLPPSELLESPLRFGRSRAGPGTLTEKGARFMLEQVCSCWRLLPFVPRGLCAPRH